MVAAPTATWSHILTQVADSLDRFVEGASAEILPLKPSFDTVEVPAAFSAPRIEEVAHPPIWPEPAVNDAGPAPASSEPEAVSDWMSTLDIINGMAGRAEAQKQRLQEQRMSHEAALAAAQRALTETQHRLHLSEMRVREVEARADIGLQRVQAEADAQVQDIRAEAEARVRTIRAEAEAWVRAAEEQVRVADLRAETAEKWLGRIDAAAKTLLLGSHARGGPAGA
ncbi:cell division protein DivIVA [Methylobacterium sp. NMS14P]|uniref:cell division protein DivIVA n=1 Tax=Methylobacterium sp. NMS14P TaxID=2894310 RepID=UPI00235845AC|nr:cell division protein DivIVA [Methylobacterium sp. NMS14P]WCS23022.1 cell division protein DivIVA [Methylobacterium sp. NMS14P]